MANETYSLSELRAKIAETGAKWTAGETKFSTMAKEERLAYLGYVPAADEPSLEEREHIAHRNLEQLVTAEVAAAYPSSYDLRNASGKNFITRVKDQGGCGSCVAFGVVATVEGHFRKQRNNPNVAIDLSEGHLYFCNSRQCNNGDPNYGWNVSPALNYFQATGVVDEACYLYRGVNQACLPCSGWQGRVKQVTAWKALASAEKMKEWLSTKGPLVACYNVYEDFFNYHGGVYKHLTGILLAGHCISVVGYNDTERYWICKNSWGANFGEENPHDTNTPKEKGYFRIAYGQCGIDSTMYAIEAIAETGWERNQRIIGLWAINEERNAWVYINEMGWRKIAFNNDNIFFNLLAQAIAAKAANRPVDFRQKDGVIEELYVF